MSGPDERPRPDGWILLLFFAVTGAALVLLGTSRYGIGINEDAASYIAAARGIVAGEGFVEYDGSPMTYWPPLYPLILAAGGLTLVDPVRVAPVANAAAFGLILLLCGLWLRRHVAHGTLRVLGMSGVLLAVPLLMLSVMALTEVFFVLWTLLTLVVLEVYLERGGVGTLLLGAVFAAFACLTRYVGPTIVLTGCLLILFARRRSLPRRLGHAVLFGAAALLPSLLWLWRNLVLTGSLTGGRGPSQRTFLENLWHSLDSLSVWLLPRPVPDGARIALLCVFVVAVVVVLALYRRARGTSLGVSPMVVFAGVYFAWMVLSATLVGFARLQERLLVPMYVPLLLVTVLAAQGLMRVFRGSSVERAVRVAVIVALAAWLTYPLARTVRYVSEYVREGAGGFSRQSWRASELIRHLREHPAEGLVHSNAPEAIYILLDRRALRGPRRSFPASVRPTNDPESFRRLLAAERSTLYVWFNSYEFRQHLYRVDELRSEYDVTVVREFTDGTVYRVGIRENP